MARKSLSSSAPSVYLNTLAKTTAGCRFICEGSPKPFSELTRQPAKQRSLTATLMTLFPNRAFAVFREENLPQSFLFVAVSELTE